MSPGMGGNSEGRVGCGAAHRDHESHLNTQGERWKQWGADRHCCWLSYGSPALAPQGCPSFPYKVPNHTFQSGKQASQLV